MSQISQFVRSAQLALARTINILPTGWHNRSGGQRHWRIHLELFALPQLWGGGGNTAPLPMLREAPVPAVQSLSIL